MSGGIDQGWLSAGVSWLLNADPDTSPYRNVKDIVVFVGAALALYFTFRRMKAADEQNKNQTKAIEAQTAQIELSRRDQLSKRFTEAVKQLGDDKLAIRMGGIAGLWAVATESTHPEDRIMVLDVLCAFVRNAEWPTAKEGQGTKPDVALVMNRLGSEGPYFPWGGQENGRKPYRRDLAGGYISGWTVEGEDWRETNFSNCLIRQFEWNGGRFDGASFEGTVFEEGSITNLREKKISFEGGALINVDFHYCVVEDLMFLDCNIIGFEFCGNKIKSTLFARSGIDFVNIYAFDNLGVIVYDSVFSNIVFNKVILRKSHFSDSFFKDVEFIDCDMNGFIIKNCILEDSKFYGCDLTHSYFHGTKSTGHDWRFCEYRKEQPPEGLPDEMMALLLIKEEPDDPAPVFLRPLGKVARFLPLFGAPFFWKKGASHRPPGGSSA